MNADQIEDLARRIESAKKPSPDLDVEVACALRWARPDAPAWLRDWKGDFAPLKGRAGHVCALAAGVSAVNWKAEPVTSSLDAGRALASARAPGIEWVAGRGKLKPRRAAVWRVLLCGRGYRGAGRNRGERSLGSRGVHGRAIARVGPSVIRRPVQRA